MSGTIAPNQKHATRIGLALGPCALYDSSAMFGGRLRDRGVWLKPPHNSQQILGGEVNIVPHAFLKTMLCGSFQLVPPTCLVKIAVRCARCVTSGKGAGVNGICAPRTPTTVIQTAFGAAVAPQ